MNIYRRFFMKYTVTKFLLIGVVSLISTQALTQTKSRNYQMQLGPPLPANQFIELAKKINPTVVSISTTIRPKEIDPFFLEFFERFYGFRYKKQPKKQRSSQRHIIGTGFIIDSSGLIVTNSHVIKQAQTAEIQLMGDDKKYYPTEIIGNDPRFDIALIKIKGKVPNNLPYVQFGDSDRVQVGEWVAAFGNPFGHSFSVSKGIISAKQRHLNELSPVPFLQTDASINPGNSGGPLVNMKGEVIGVNAAIDARAQGIGFAIPINIVKQIKPQLQKLGYVVRGYLGVGIDNINFKVREVLGLSDQEGALVLQVEKGSPADKAGIQNYDIIKSFNNKKIENATDLINTVKSYEVGKMATIQIIRQGKLQALKVKIGTTEQSQQRILSKKTEQKRKQGFQAPHRLGFQLSNFNSELAQKYGLNNPPFQRPIVNHVVSNSAAWQSGLREGDMILDVNRQPVTSTASSVFQKLKRGQNVLRVLNKNNISLVFLDI